MESGGIIGIIFGIVVVIGGGIYVSMQKPPSNNKYELTSPQYYRNTRKSYPRRYNYPYGNSYSSSSSSYSYRRRYRGGNPDTTKNKTKKNV